MSGSITGAPKKRAMEIIRELEPRNRGTYCGAIGWLGYNGESSFNIAIRTLVRNRGTLIYQVGAGIVADSDPQHEYEETLHKPSTKPPASAWRSSESSSPSGPTPNFSSTTASLPITFKPSLHEP
jgi:anthranilate/para-aminobenzoate synthase component I